ncbi:MAG TPA: hypothetical protein DD412_07145 [Holosporales bacterium]|nr:hypothetical protein [Holosporales bacterium]
MEIHKTQFNVEEMLKTLKAIAEPLSHKNNNKLIFLAEESIGEIISDEGKLKQSLLNLLSNASKFTKNGNITLGCYTKQKNKESPVYLIFSVSDTGCGIPEPKQIKLFNAFSQADSSVTKEYGGTGLGLTITKQFCELMGGDVHIKSIYGKGSTFKINIPLCRPMVQIKKKVIAN